jgi:hypothetical protein
MNFARTRCTLCPLHSTSLNLLLNRVPPDIPLSERALKIDRTTIFVWDKFSTSGKLVMKGGSMNTQSCSFYVHRSNEDGSYDSICVVCYATVASARDETELNSHEHTHVCIPNWPYRAGNIG